MGIGPVVYRTEQVLGPCDVREMIWQGADATLLRGAVIRTVPQALLATFELGPGMDADLYTSGPLDQQFAGILDDSSVGDVTAGDAITVITPYMNTIVWCRVASGLDNGDGVLIQLSATDQGFADSAAYLAADFGVCLLDEDAADNPFTDDNLAPIKFTYGLAP